MRRIGARTTAELAATPIEAVHLWVGPATQNPPFSGQVARLLNSAGIRNGLCESSDPSIETRCSRGPRHRERISAAGALLCASMESSGDPKMHRLLSTRLASTISSQIRHCLCRRLGDRNGRMSNDSRTPAAEALTAEWLSESALVFEDEPVGRPALRAGHP